MTRDEWLKVAGLVAQVALGAILLAMLYSYRGGWYNVGWTVMTVGVAGLSLSSGVALARLIYWRRKKEHHLAIGRDLDRQLESFRR